MVGTISSDKESLRSSLVIWTRLLQILLPRLLVPGLMKFMGALAHFQPDVLARYPNFTNTMFNCIDDSDVSMRMIAIKTTSFIATERDGKFALNQPESTRYKIRRLPFSYLNTLLI
jgi:hypothetical protein